MSNGRRIGIPALILWATGTVLAFRAPEPAGLALLAIAFVLGCIAASKGNKWWLILPFSMLVELCLGLSVAFAAL